MLPLFAEVDELLDLLSITPTRIKDQSIVMAQVVATIPVQPWEE